MELSEQYHPTNSIAFSVLGAISRRPRVGMMPDTIEVAISDQAAKTRWKHRLKSKQGCIRAYLDMSRPDQRLRQAAQAHLLLGRHYP